MLSGVGLKRTARVRANRPFSQCDSFREKLCTPCTAAMTEEIESSSETPRLQ